MVYTVGKKNAKRTVKKLKLKLDLNGILDENNNYYDDGTDENG